MLTFSRFLRPALVRLLEVQLGEPRPVQQHDLTLGLAKETENALVVQERERARNGLQREPEIVGDIAAAHWQRHNAGRRQSPLIWINGPDVELRLFDGGTALRWATFFK